MINYTAYCKDYCACQATCLSCPSLARNRDVICARRPLEDLWAVGALGKGRKSHLWPLESLRPDLDWKDPLLGRSHSSRSEVPPVCLLIKLPESPLAGAKSTLGRRKIIKFLQLGSLAPASRRPPTTGRAADDKTVWAADGQAGRQTDRQTDRLSGATLGPFTCPNTSRAPSSRRVRQLVDFGRACRPKFA